MQLGIPPSTLLINMYECTGDDENQRFCLQVCSQSIHTLWSLSNGTLLFASLFPVSLNLNESCQIKVMIFFFILSDIPLAIR